MRVAILGLGEAGGIYAEGFVARGVDVTGYDPVAAHTPAGVSRRPSIAAAVADAELVLSMVGAAASGAVLCETIDSLPAGAVFADLNTAAPARKAELADRARAAGVSFADVAIMAPVPRAGAATPVLVSGDGADRVAAVWAELGIPVTDVGAEAGTAAGLKMLRSVFMKGLAGLVMESVSAAETAGDGAWMRAEIAGELGPDGAALVDRLIDGTRTHAARREHEMHDALGYLESLGSETWMTRGTLEWLHALAQNPAFPGRAQQHS
ncbi:hypothetical protein BH11ACT2_BH11ACT2_05530 [soil metagenome]